MINVSPIIAASATISSLHNTTTIASNICRNSFRTNRSNNSTFKEARTRFSQRKQQNKKIKSKMKNFIKIEILQSINPYDSKKLKVERIINVAGIETVWVDMYTVGGKKLKDKNLYEYFLTFCGEKYSISKESFEKLNKILLEEDE